MGCRPAAGRSSTLADSHAGAHLLHVRDLAGYVDEHALYGRHGFSALEAHGRDLLRDTPVEDRTVLDIGAGDGLLSLWLLHRGARTVVSLEPEADGAAGGAARRAEAHRRRLRVPAARWRYLRTTLQSYRADRRFSLAVSVASVNHLDETACATLLDRPGARATYLALFRKVHRLLEPGGRFVIADVARVNYWNRLGWASPWAPEIEWEKHQEPETWAAVAKDAGFRVTSVRWRHPFLRAAGLGPLARTRLAARLLASQFALTLER